MRYLRANRGRNICLLFAFVVSLLQAQESSTIAGSVVDSVTGAGIPGVTVYYGSEQGVHYDAVTDAAGNFEIPNVRNGQYGSHFEKTGYISRYSGTNDSTLKAVPVSAGPESVRLRIELVAFATLQGRVLDPQGKPAAKATVTFGQDTEVSDEQGRFAFTGLSPGSLTLQASPSDSDLHPVQAPGEDRSEVVPTWFPSVIESDLAEPIVVHGGANLSGYEIRLRTAPVYRVRSVVLGENGKPEPRAMVYNASSSQRSFSSGLFNMGGLRKGQNGETTVSKGGPFGYFTMVPSSVAPILGREGLSTKDGSFEFPSVPRGTRQFTASIEPDDISSPQLPVTATVSVVVDRDIDDLQIRLATPFTMEGSVELAGATGPRDPDILRQAFVSLNGRSLGPTTRPDGSVRFENVVPGSYRILAAPGLPGGYYLASVSVGGREVIGQPVTLAAGSPSIHVVYKPNGGTVTGTADEGAIVVLIPEASLESLTVDFGRVCPSGPGGAFEIGSVGPGSYYAFAVERLLPLEFYDPQIVRKIVSSATLVQITEGSVISVKLRIIRLEE